MDHLNPLSIFTHFSLCVLFLLFFVSLTSAANYISHKHSLSGRQELTSEGGTFVLGFFQPGNSSYYYLGIWYDLKRVSQLTAVWVANRENPITDPKKAKLKISADGNLVLSNKSNPRIWSTNTTPASNSIVAILLDSGNLVLRERSNHNITLWQSFDHLTHTSLPGGKIGLNKVTREFQRLISWKNIDDPAPGIFSHEIDPNGTSQLFLLWNYTYRYWSSGTWNGKLFTLIPEMTAYSSDKGRYGYSFNYVSNAAENYFTYSVRSDIVTRVIVDVSGQLKVLTWVEDIKKWILLWAAPKLQCQVHVVCGPFGNCNENLLPFCNCIKGFSEESPSNWDMGDQTAGCTRNTPLQCSKNSSIRMEGDRFYTMSNIRMPDNARSLQASSAAGCELGCLSNCSCTAYTYNDATGCSVWYGDLLNIQENYGGPDRGTLFLRLAASELPNPNNHKMVVVISSVVGPVSGFFTLLVIVYLLIWKRRRISIVSTIGDGGLIAFRYVDLQHATKNFSVKLGSGGFGSVFEGILPNSTKIAVKKLEGLQQGEKQFRAEVRTIGTVQHVNLVQLLGFCSEGKHKLLVYEYMPNGSLNNQLFTQDSTRVLDWKTRYQIALGTARGLAYLHEQCRECIIHCDIKPENVLLDASFVPKVADFGLAKLIGHDFSRVLTTIRGTIGYLAPEWISGVAVTAKADVYSYGMMLFEIISGKRNLNQDEESELSFFPSLAACNLIEGDIISLLDPRLEGDPNLDEVGRACKAACWCVQDDENSRPSMGQVVQILEGILEVNIPPIPQALQILADKPKNIKFCRETSSDCNPQS